MINFKKFFILLIFINLKTEFNKKFDAFLAASISSFILKILNLNINQDNMEYKFKKDFSINNIEIGKELNDFSFEVLTELVLNTNLKSIYQDMIKEGNKELNEKALSIFDSNFGFLVKIINNSNGIYSFIKNKLSKMPKKIATFFAIFGALNSYKDNLMDKKIEIYFKNTKNEKLKKFGSKIGLIAVKKILMSKIIELMIPFVAIFTCNENENFDLKDSEDLIKQSYNLTELGILGIEAIKSNFIN